MWLVRRGFRSCVVETVVFVYGRIWGTETTRTYLVSQVHLKVPLIIPVSSKNLNTMVDTNEVLHELLPRDVF